MIVLSLEVMKILELPRANKARVQRSKAKGQKSGGLLLYI